MDAPDIYEPSEDEFEDKPEDEDDARMRRAAKGDAAAFGEIVRAYQGRVGGFAARMLGGDYAAAEDVTQETFLRLWRGRCAYRAQGNLRGFLFQIAANLCRDWRRAEGGRMADTLDDFPDLASLLPSPADALQAATLADAVRQAVHDLPHGQRAVFVLSHYEGCSGLPRNRRNLGLPHWNRRLAQESRGRHLAPPTSALPGALTCLIRLT